jgi:hypothetical protein
VTQAPTDAEHQQRDTGAEECQHERGDKEQEEQPEC